MTLEPRGVATSTYAIWIVAAFGMTALWALVVVVNKKILESVTPVAVNFFIRLVAIAGLLLITVPLTVFGLWSNGFGINAAAAGWIALSAVATWLVAFNAYYYALRGERVAVVAPISAPTRSGRRSSPGSSRHRVRRATSPAWR